MGLKELTMCFLDCSRSISVQGHQSTAAEECKGVSSTYFIADFFSPTVRLFCNVVGWFLFCLLWRSVSFKSDLRGVVQLTLPVEIRVKVNEDELKDGRDNLVI